MNVDVAEGAQLELDLHLFCKRKRTGYFRAILTLDGPTVHVKMTVPVEELPPTKRTHWSLHVNSHG